MADLQEELQAILGDPQAMGQITAIARAITGGAPLSNTAPPAQVSAPQGGAPLQAPPPVGDVDYVPVEDTPPQSSPTQAPPSQAAQDQAAPAQGAPMPDLTALMGLLGGGNGPDIDPKLIQIALRVYTEYSAQDNQKAALLAALKPFLREERLEKMEKAEKVARLSRLVRIAIQLLKEEGDGHV